MPFRKIHYLLPLIAMLLGVFLQYSDLDIWIEHFFYDDIHHNWPFEHGWLTSTVLHSGGQSLVTLIALAIIIFAIASLFINKIKKYRKEAWYLMLASLTGVAIIGKFKSITHIYSPWDLLVFGGKYPHIRLFDAVANSNPVGYAFPAGHAGGGFALLSFYFLLRAKQATYRHYFLYIALSVGFIFGIDQDIRGAHMLSHDLFSLAICWLACMGWYLLFFKKSPTPAISAS